MSYLLFIIYIAAVLTVTVSLQFDIQWNDDLLNISSSSAGAFSVIVENIVSYFFIKVNFLFENVKQSMP